MTTANVYLEQVVEQQRVVDRELRNRRGAPSPAEPAASAPLESPLGTRAIAANESDEASPHAIDTRITGWWLFKTVVVPPNVYVVHTRRGYDRPLHVGLGISFRYNPATDAFLVIPAAVQTLLINARCISSERQGVLVQAYVQWVVDDIATAYRRLDFSDPQDPMRIVNVQLREQAEAAIKDKVATLNLDEVLTDKQPVIEELTHRLRVVAEGSREGDGAAGLGLKIVTVQIKEAVVSSTRLWENLQKPFRAERERLARLAELDAQQQVARQEVANQLAREKAALENEQMLAQLRAEQQREAYDREQAEKARRHKAEQEAEVRAVAERAATEKARREVDLNVALHEMDLAVRRKASELEDLKGDADLDRARAERDRARAAATAELEAFVHQAAANREERDVVLLKLRRAVENDVSDPYLRSQMIARLPEIAAALPKPDELHAVTVGGDQAGPAGALVHLLSGLMRLADGTPLRPGPTNGHQG